MMEENKVHEQNEIAIFGAVKSALAQLKTEYGNRVYDVTTYEGLTVAKQARAEVRKWRTTLEKARKQEKAQYLEAGRRLDAGAKELTTELLSIEAPIDEIIKAEEAKKAEAKRIKEEAEKARIDGIMDVISEITARPARHFRSTAIELADAIGEFGKYTSQVDDGFFAEFTIQAKATIEKTMEEMMSILNSAKAAEAEAVRLVEEQKLIDAEKKAIAEAKAKDDAALAAKEAELAEDKKAHDKAVAAQVAEQEKVNAEIAENRKKLAQEQAEAAEVKRLAEVAEKERQEREAEERARTKPITEENLKVAVDELEEAGIEYMYESQAEALNAIYVLCFSGLMDDADTVAKVGLIAKYNMEVE